MFQKAKNSFLLAPAVFAPVPDLLTPGALSEHLCSETYHIMISFVLRFLLGEPCPRPHQNLPHLAGSSCHQQCHAKNKHHPMHKGFQVLVGWSASLAFCSKELKNINVSRAGQKQFQGHWFVSTWLHSCCLPARQLAAIWHLLPATWYLQCHGSQQFAHISVCFLTKINSRCWPDQHKEPQSCTCHSCCWLHRRTTLHIWLHMQFGSLAIGWASKLLCVQQPWIGIALLASSQCCTVWRRHAHHLRAIFQSSTYRTYLQQWWHRLMGPQKRQGLTKKLAVRWFAWWAHWQNELLPIVTNRWN